MYDNRADAKKIRFNLSVNEAQRARFAQEAEARRMQVTPTILELALEGLKWRELHARNSVEVSMGMRRANA